MSIERLLDDHGGAARSRARLPVGPRADLGHDRAAHARGGLRTRRRHRARRSGAGARRTRRPAVPGRVPVAHRRGAGAVRLRRGRRLRSATSSSAATRTCSARLRSPRRPSRPLPGSSTRRPSARPPARASGVLDGVTLGLPALTRAAKLGRRAATVRFDWPHAAGRARQGARKSAASCRERWRAATAATLPRNSATCCSASPSWRGISARIPKRRCARPTPSSSGVSGASRRFLPSRAARRARRATAELEALWARAKQELR